MAYLAYSATRVVYGSCVPSLNRGRTSGVLVCGTTGPEMDPLGKNTCSELAGSLVLPPIRPPPQVGVTFYPFMAAPVQERIDLRAGLKGTHWKNASFPFGFRKHIPEQSRAAHCGKRVCMHI